MVCAWNGVPADLVGVVSALTMERLRDAIASAHELDHLSREIAASYEQLALLHSSSAEAGAAHDVGAICAHVLDQIATQAPGTAAAVFLLDEDSGRPRTVATHGEMSDEFSAPAPGMPDGILSHVLQTGEPAVAPGVATAGAGGGGSLLCLPLIAHQRLMGAICVRDQAAPLARLARQARVIGVLAAHAAFAISNTALLRDVKSLLLGTVRSLASAVDAKDPCTLGHSQRVTQYALTIARELGLSRAECDELQLAALLHDVGKIGLPDKILLKAGKLTAAEWEQVRKHPVWGEEILRPIRQLRQVATWIRHEHERWNGSGYPDGLAGNQIPLASRVIAVADAFDALTSEREYRRAVSPPEAMAIVNASAGSEFDPRVVAAFLAAFAGDRVA